MNQACIFDSKVDHLCHRFDSKEYSYAFSIDDAFIDSDDFLLDGSLHVIFEMHILVEIDGYRNNISCVIWNFGLVKEHIQNRVVASPPIEICKFVFRRSERDTQSTSSCQIAMNKKEGDGDYLEVTMKQADRCIYKFQISDGVWGNNIFTKMSDLDDEVKIKLILHGIDQL